MSVKYIDINGNSCSLYNIDLDNSIFGSDTDTTLSDIFYNMIGFPVTKSSQFTTKINGLFYKWTEETGKNNLDDFLFDLTGNRNLTKEKTKMDLNLDFFGDRFSKCKPYECYNSRDPKCFLEKQIPGERMIVRDIDVLFYELRIFGCDKSKVKITNYRLKYNNSYLFNFKDYLKVLSSCSETPIGISNFYMSRSTRFSEDYIYLSKCFNEPLTRQNSVTLHKDELVSQLSSKFTTNSISKVTKDLPNSIKLHREFYPIFMNHLQEGMVLTCK